MRDATFAQDISVGGLVFAGLSAVGRWLQTSRTP
jgi:hypothetical protein